MQQALTTPAFRSVVVGGILLGLGVAAATIDHACDDATRRLVLHTVSEPDAIYLSAWDGDVLRVRFHDQELRPITFTMRAKVHGCHLLATETLTPIDARTFAYAYDEQVLSCEKGAAIRKTPRSGIVTIAND